MCKYDSSKLLSGSKHTGNLECIYICHNNVMCITNNAVNNPKYKISAERFEPIMKR